MPSELSATFGTPDIPNKHVPSLESFVFAAQSHTDEAQSSASLSLLFLSFLINLPCAVVSCRRLGLTVEVLVMPPSPVPYSPSADKVDLSAG